MLPAMQGSHDVAGRIQLGGESHRDSQILASRRGATTIRKSWRLRKSPLPEDRISWVRTPLKP